MSEASLTAMRDAQCTKESPITHTKGSPWTGVAHKGNRMKENKLKWGCNTKIKSKQKH
jgi:hypothetical protein